MRQILNTLLIAVLSRPSRPQQRQSAVSGTSVVIPGLIGNRKVVFFRVFNLISENIHMVLLPLSPMLPSVVPGLVSLLVSLIISSASHCFAYLECAMSRPPHRVPSPAPLTRSF